MKQDRLCVIQMVEVYQDGALTIPDCSWPKILKKYTQIRPALLNGNSEVKGRYLREDQIAKVIGILRKNDALFEFTLVDLSLEKDSEIKKHQQEVISFLGGYADKGPYHVQ